MQGVYCQKYSEASTQKKLERDSKLIQKKLEMECSLAGENTILLIRTSYFEKLQNCVF